MDIKFTKLAKKQLLKAPQPIQQKLKDWIKLLEAEGLAFVRTVKSYHDEPLQGQRMGQRSVRLNRQWRAIYEELTGTLLSIQEITPHDYRTR
jgi:proteic killer suppression protein